MRIRCLPFLTMPLLDLVSLNRLNLIYLWTLPQCSRSDGVVLVKLMPNRSYVATATCAGYQRCVSA